MDHLIIVSPSQYSHSAGRLTWAGSNQAHRLVEVLRQQFGQNRIGRILTTETPEAIATANILAAGLVEDQFKDQKWFEERKELGLADGINYHRFMFLLRGLYVLETKTVVVIADNHYVNRAPVDFLKSVVGLCRPRLPGRAVKKLAPGQAWHIYCQEGEYWAVPF